MVGLGMDVLLAFPMAERSGAWNCAQRAEAAGIHVMYPEVWDS